MRAYSDFPASWGFGAFSEGFSSPFRAFPGFSAFRAFSGLSGAFPGLRLSEAFRGPLYAFPPFPSSFPRLPRFLQLPGSSRALCTLFLSFPCPAPSASWAFRAFCGLFLLLGLPGASRLFLPLPSFPVFSFLFLRLRRLSSSRAFLHGSSFCKGATGFPPFPARARGCRAYHSVSTGEKGIIRLMLAGCRPCRGIAGPRISASPPEKKIKDISS